MSDPQPYPIPPAIHQYETRFYGMSMNGLLIAALLLIVGFLSGNALIDGVFGLIFGLVAGLLLGGIGLAFVTPFPSLDDQIPPAYWLTQFRHRHETTLIIPPLSHTAPHLDNAMITDWDGAEIARLS